jgi:hypothetical protein
MEVKIMVEKIAIVGNRLMLKMEGRKVIRSYLSNI